MGTIGGFRTEKVICLVFLTGSLWLLCWEQTHTVTAVRPGGDDWNNPGKRQWRQETVKSHWILDIFCYETNNFLTDWIYEKGSRMISRLRASWLWAPYAGVIVMAAVELLEFFHTHSRAWRKYPDLAYIPAADTEVLGPFYVSPATYPATILARYMTPWLVLNAFMMNHSLHRSMWPCVFEGNLKIICGRLLVVKKRQALHNQEKMVFDQRPRDRLKMQSCQERRQLLAVLMASLLFQYTYSICFPWPPLQIFEGSRVTGLITMAHSQY